MKHLKKKYIRHFKLNTDVAKELQKIPVDVEGFEEIKQKNLEGYYGLVYTEDNELFQTFKYEKDGKIYMIPEPNPTVIYFDSARHYYMQLKGQRGKVFEGLKMFYQNIGAVNGDFYWYFSLASSYAIFLFSAIEAFVNRLIPNDFEYCRQIQNRRTEMFNKFQIQREIEFAEKLKSVISEVTGKNFVAEHTHKFEQIKKLKTFRDEIAHTKTYDGKNIPNPYENLYALSLNFEFEKTLYYVRDFINYYEPNLIEECNCGKP